MRSRFLDFEEARDIVRNMGFYDYYAWKRYCKTGEKNIRIPADPYGVYRNKWISWGDWLGNGRIHGSKRKYSVNDHFFKTWTADMAYILGFWWADGFITAKQFSITQHKDDVYILEKILSSMRSNYPIRYHFNDNMRFFIKSEDIVRDIKGLGGNEHKKYRTSVPTAIPKKYVSHFVRGYFDGDGSVVVDKKLQGVSSTMVSCSKKFLRNLRKAIVDQIPEVHPHIYKHITPKGTKVCKGILRKDSVNYVLKLFKNDSRKLYEFMYRNSTLHLKRKKEKFEKFSLKIEGPSETTSA